MEDYDPTMYGRRVAPVYDDTVRGLPTAAAVERLAALAAGGPVLEFGVGTGRLALPLAARGLAVTGVDSSAEMLAGLRAKPGGADLPVVVGDFADVRVGGRFALVVLAINTLFALPDQEAQVRCMANAAAHLLPGGRFVVEAWVPDPAGFADGSRLRVLNLSEREVTLEAAWLHPAEQRMSTTKVRLTDGGARLLPANHRYAWPAELDLMAQLAGLRREHRWADWEQTPFTDASRAHVTVYRQPDATAAGPAENVQPDATAAG